MEGTDPMTTVVVLHAIILYVVVPKYNIIHTQYDI